MTELIKVRVSEKGNQLVSARDIHEFLGVKSQFTDWIKNQFERAMLVENEDFILVTEKKVTNNSKNPLTELKDYAMKLSAAKEIAMLNGGDKGKQARLYFIECEKKLQLSKMASYQIEDPIARAERWIEEQKERNKLTIELKSSQDNVSRLIHTAKTYTSGEIAKELNLKSAIELNKILHEKGVQFKQNRTWLLYSKYADLGYTSTKQIILDNGSIAYDRQWTGIGRDFIVSLFGKTDYLYNDSSRNVS